MVLGVKRALAILLFLEKTKLRHADLESFHRREAPRLRGVGASVLPAARYQGTTTARHIRFGAARCRHFRGGGASAALI